MHVRLHAHSCTRAHTHTRSFIHSFATRATHSALIFPLTFDLFVCVCVCVRSGAELTRKLDTAEFLTLILPLVDGLQDDPSWRVRQQLAKTMPKIAERVDPNEVGSKKLLPIFAKMLKGGHDLLVSRLLCRCGRVKEELSNCRKRVTSDWCVVSCCVSRQGGGGACVGCALVGPCGGGLEGRSHGTHCGSPRSARLRLFTERTRYCTHTPSMQHAGPKAARLADSVFVCALRSSCSYGVRVRVCCSGVCVCPRGSVPTFWSRSCSQGEPDLTRVSAHWTHLRVPSTFALFRCV